MNIQEATKKAVEIDGYIVKSEEDGKKVIFIKPTNGIDCCVVNVTKNHSRRGWQPTASDLISDEWEVVTEEDFLALSERNSTFLR